MGFTENDFRPWKIEEREREREREIVQSRARRYRPPTSLAPRRSRLRKALITIAQSADRADRNLAFVPIAIARSVRIWWFFSGFCLCFEKWMILYIRLATEKIWATSRKCVFYGIFKNTTKHQKIFFENFFEMQPNTWKHFPFRKIVFLENRIFFGNTFTRTKQSLNQSNLHFQYIFIFIFIFFNSSYNGRVRIWILSPLKTF